jgi:ubiquinone/menaquinone biosynthesis C-methylase UbiE
MNIAIKNFIETCSLLLKPREEQVVVVEFGGRKMPGQEEFANVGAFFAGDRFISTDYLPGPGVDIVDDLRNLSMSSESCDIAVCSSVLEHVDQPFVAVREIFRVLKPGGYLMFTVPMKIRIHGSPFDYWRFTPDGVRKLLELFEDVVTVVSGDPAFPDDVMCLARKTLEISPKIKTELGLYQIRITPRSIKLRDHAIYLAARSFMPLIFLDSNYEFFKRAQHKSRLAKCRHLFWLLQPAFMRNEKRR